MEYKGQERTLDLFVTEDPYSSLLGMTWLPALGIGLTGINQATITAPSQQKFEEVSCEFPDIFDGKLRLCKGPPITLPLNPAVRPIHIPACRVPLALKPKIDEELDKLVEQGVLELVAHGQWETPIVTSIKPNGSVHICVDYKCTLNKALPAHECPVPIVSQVLATLAGAKMFGKLDLAQAYQELPLTQTQQRPTPS